jgi:triacylglycerol lipase
MFLKVLLTALTLLFIVQLFVLVVSYALFWRETFYRTHNLPASTQVVKRRMMLWVLKGILSGLFGIAPLFLFFPLGFWKGMWRPKPGMKSSLPPVILIHGLYHNASAWIMYRWVLRKAGFSHIYAFSYDSWRPTFQELLEKLDELVEEAILNSPDGRVILIGHSLGGLLCRAYVESAQHSRKVRAVVTLGTPHQGSTLAWTGIGRLARSLAHKGQLIMRLERDAVHSSVPRLAIYSPVDNMVLPSSALRPMGPGWVLVESAPISHVAILYHRRTARVVVDFLHQICRSRGRSSCEADHLSVFDDNSGEGTPQPRKFENEQPSSSGIAGRE